MTTTIVFSDKHAFRQAAFDEVGQVIFNYAEELIIAGNMAPKSEELLKHLEHVAQAWGYSAVRITVLADMVEEENNNIREYYDGLEP